MQSLPQRNYLLLSPPLTLLLRRTQANKANVLILLSRHFLHVHHGSLVVFWVSKGQELHIYIFFPHSYLFRAWQISVNIC